MLNVECGKLHDRSLKFFRGMLLNGDPGGFVFFFDGDCQKRGLSFSWRM